MDLEDSPELDHGPEVFETSDVESETSPSHQDEANENIARDALVSAKEASSAFESSVIEDDLELVNFSGTVAGMLSHSGYKVAALETRQQKLARIAQELEELEKVDQGVEIDALGQKLSQLRASEALEKDFDLDVSAIFDNIDNALAEDVKPDTKKTAEVLRLEERIAQLEDLLGTADETPSNLQNSIKSTLRKITILLDHESELDNVKSDIKKLTKDMEALAASRRMAQVASGSKDPVVVPITFDHKVSTLFDRLPEFDKVNSTVPHIITRLKSLNHIHSESGHAVDCISTLDSTLSDITQDMKKWDEAIDKIDRSIDAQSAAFEKNSATFERRMRDALERIDKLEASR